MEASHGKRASEMEAKSMSDPFLSKTNQFLKILFHQNLYSSFNHNFSSGDGKAGTQNSNLP